VGTDCVSRYSEVFREVVTANVSRFPRVIPLSTNAAVTFPLALGIVFGTAITPRATAETRHADTPPTAHMPGPWPSRQTPLIPDPALLNAECESCHPVEAEQWRSSFHAKAYVNPAFQRALAIEPLAFCRGCHAPESNPLTEGKVKLQELGVACVSCHIVDGPVLATEGNHSASPHSISRTPAFGTSYACVRCHEFPFPGESAKSGVELMQNTVAEHRASEYRDVSCASCHMSRDSKGRRDHRFDVTRNPSFLRNALGVKVTRFPSGRVEFQLTSKGVGHAFPTGDLFRRIRVHIDVLGPEYSTLTSADAFLTRTFETTKSPAGVTRRVNTSDTRISADPTKPSRVSFDFSLQSLKFPILYSITYERVEHPGKIGHPDAVLEGIIELASGRIPPENRANALK
jgi:Cytochrome c554 and c-prime